MKAAILLAADIIRKLDQARLHFEVSTLDQTVHPLLAPDPDNPSLPTFRIYVSDHEANFFQPCTAVSILVRPGVELPTVRVLNHYSHRSPKSEATNHTLTMFKARLQQHRASFPMNVLE